MNNHIVIKNKAKHLQRIFAVLITAALFTVTISTSTVSAYYTSGANGRSLEVIPGFTVNQLIAPAGTACREQQMLRSFTGVTIHETSNWSSGANARMHALYLWDAGRNNDVSWHYIVDSTTAYQCIPESEKSWHAGDTANGVGNASTISIEICDNANGNFDQAMANAEWLAADVLYRHGVYSVNSHLFQHNQFSAFSKNCPITIRDTGRWQEFCVKTQRYLDQMVGMNGSYAVSDSNGDILITGTPANVISISRVDIYADDYRNVGSAPILNGNISCTVDSGLLTTGWHIFKMAAINNDGSVRWTNYSYLIGPESQMLLDNPASNVLYYGDLAISGWAVSHAGIFKIEVYDENMTLLGSTSNMYARDDVNVIVNSSGRYKDALHSGFACNIGTRLLSEGIHVINVAAISNDGTKQWNTRTINIGLKAQACLDLPGTGENTGDISVSGWAVSVEGITRVDIYVDENRCIGSTSNMLERADVNNIVNSDRQYKDALHSGFNFTIDSSVLTPGTHVLKVAAISNDGTAQWLIRSFVVGPEATASLESPSDQEVSGDILVSGWAVGHSGIARVDIYVDNNRCVGSTSNMQERADVNSIINSSGQYKDALHSGFSYSIDASVLTPGIHVLKVAAIGNDGTAQWLIRSFIVGP